MSYKAIQIDDDATVTETPLVDETAAIAAYGVALNTPGILLYWIWNYYTSTWFVGGPQ